MNTSESYAIPTPAMIAAEAEERRRATHAREVARRVRQVSEALRSDPRKCISVHDAIEVVNEVATLFRAAGWNCEVNQPDAEHDPSVWAVTIQQPNHV